jgi:histidine triad (HIT) family protein
LLEFIKSERGTLIDCIFCKIIGNKIPAQKVNEDKDFIAILDINPVSKGHALIIPKKHCFNLFDMNEELLEKTLKVAQKIGNAMKKALNTDSINLIQNNGAYAEQLIFHSHFHLIPRFPDDGIKIGMVHKKYDEGEISKFAEMIRKGF